MSRLKFNTLLVIGAIILALVLFLFWDGKQGTDWNLTLKPKGGQPYDLDVLYESLQTQLGERYREIPEEGNFSDHQNDIEAEDSSLYFYVGNQLHFSSDDLDAMEEYIKHGGRVFISALNISSEFYNKFPWLRSPTYLTGKDSVAIQFRNKKFNGKSIPFYYQRNGKQEYGTYNYFFTKPLSDSGTSFKSLKNLRYYLALSVFDKENVNFYYSSNGDGGFYMHSNPQFFSNIYLQTEAGRTHLSQVTQLLRFKKLWADKSGMVIKPWSDEEGSSYAVYTFISSDRGLLYATIILLSGMLLFLVLGGRRRQRSIPCMEQPANSSLAMISAMGHFYLSEKSNIYVFHKEWNLFLQFLRHRFYFQLETFDEVTIQKLSEKSGVSQQTIQDIFLMYEKYSIFSHLRTDELVDATQTINQFYTEYRQQYGNTKQRRTAAINS